MTERKTKTKTAAKVVADEADLARKIWLAGVGAYGRAFSEAQEKIEKISDIASEAFDQLVARGEKVEESVKHQIAGTDAAKKIAGAVGKFREYGVERQAILTARLDGVRKSVGDSIAPFNPLPYLRTVDQLNEKMDALTAEVAALRQAAATAKVSEAKTDPVPAKVEPVNVETAAMVEAPVKAAASSVPEVKLVSKARKPTAPKAK